MGKKFYDWEANIPFSVHRILSRNRLIPHCEGNPGTALDTVLAPSIQQKSDFGVHICLRSAIFSNTSNSLRYGCNPPSEVG